MALERAGIPFTLHEYPHDPRHESYGQEASEALAAASGGKKAAMAQVAAAERATGYVAGGISPVGQRKRLPVVLDESAMRFATVFCSAGRRGLEIEIAPADLVRATDAKVASIGRIPKAPKPPAP